MYYIILDASVIVDLCRGEEGDKTGRIHALIYRVAEKFTREDRIVVKTVFTSEKKESSRRLWRIFVEKFAAEFRYLLDYFYVTVEKEPQKYEDIRREVGRTNLLTEARRLLGLKPRAKDERAAVREEVDSDTHLLVSAIYLALRGRYAEILTADREACDRISGALERLGDLARRIGLTCR